MLIMLIMTEALPCNLNVEYNFYTDAAFKYVVSGRVRTGSGWKHSPRSEPEPSSLVAFRTEYAGSSFPRCASLQGTAKPNSVNKL